MGKKSWKRMATSPFGKSLVAFAGAIVGGLVGFRVQHMMIERERVCFQNILLFFLSFSLSRPFLSGKNSPNV